MNQPSLATHNHQYKGTDNKPTQFEIYLKYSTEKEESVKSLSKILRDIYLTNKKMLDIGCGDGTYLLSTLDILQDVSNYNITLLEPSKALYSNLIQRSSGYSNVKTVNSTFEDFHSKNKDSFDVILASHLYHFSRDEYRGFIDNILSLLDKVGVLIWVERAPDDIAVFKKKFKQEIFPEKYPEDWEPRDYKRVYEILSSIPNSSCKLVLNESELRIPYGTNIEDSVAIIEFYLDIEWLSLTDKTRDRIMQYIRDRDGVFVQREGVVVYTQRIND